MKPANLLISLLFLLITAAALAQQDKKEIRAILNQASQRLMQGDITALDDVKALPGDDSVAGLLMFFKQNFYVFSKETKKKAIAAKAAQYITECPTAADYITRLFKKEPGREKSRMLGDIRQTTLDMLTAVGNSFAIRLLFNLMEEPDLDVPASDFAVALSKMNIPSAPFGRDEWKSGSRPDGITKWKEWWQANKAAHQAN